MLSTKELTFSGKGGGGHAPGGTPHHRAHRSSRSPDRCDGLGFQAPLERRQLPPCGCDQHSLSLVCPTLWTTERQTQNRNTCPGMGGSRCSWLSAIWRDQTSLSMR